MIARIGLFTLAATASGSWVYRWPYGDSNICECEERFTNGSRYLEFENYDDCIESFSLEDTEYCSSSGSGSSGGGFTVRKCEGAVSIRYGWSNSDCRTLCTEAIVAGGVTAGGGSAVTTFFESCSLELTDPALGIPIGEQDCFSNYVYGNSDYDPASQNAYKPLGFYSDVDTPSECQELCQLTADCAYFSFRNKADDASTTSSYQNAVGTCLLYDSEYLEGVLNYDLTSTPPFDGRFCDLGAYTQVCGSSNADTYNPFDTTFDRCLLCGCVSRCSWKTNTHITGPRFCGDKLHNLCSYPNTDFTTTTEEPPSECPPTQEHCPDECYTTTTSQNTSADTTTVVEIETTTAIELDTTTTPHSTEQDTTTAIELDTTTTAQPDTTTTTRTLPEIQPTQVTPPVLYATKAPAPRRLALLGEEEEEDQCDEC